MIKNLKIKKSTTKKERTAYQVDEGPTDIKDCDSIPESQLETCRICISGESSKKNPLIAPCNCTGSMKFVHYECLKQWLNRDLNTVRNDNVTSYYWASFECEVCKLVYPCSSFISL